MSDFWLKVSKGDGCWLWLGARQGMGYGVVRIGGRNVLAHRHALALHGVGIPPGAIVRHHCDTPACVRPDHLEVGTHKQNTADMVSRGRARHGSANGSKHPFAKMTEAQVAACRTLMACGVKASALARLFGVSQTKMSHIKLGKSWRHVPPLEAT